jgi:hypothetical protein
MSKKKQKYFAPKLVDSFPAPLALGLKAFTITGFIILAIQLARGPGQSEGRPTNPSGQQAGRGR